MTMIAASADSLLRVWEEQQRAHPVKRALHLLDAAWPENGWDAWLHASIGKRDGALLVLHESLFGSDLHTTTACPHCCERLESEFSVQDVRSGGALPEATSGLCLRQQSYMIDYRLPTSDDLLHVAGQNVDDAVLQLLQRCVLRAQQGTDEIDVASLPQSIVANLAGEMAQVDPDADVRIALVCPACGTAWQTCFDIVSYLWGEFDDWAQRTLADVHTLARAYGWSEGAVLALSPVRRQIYLEMVSA
jgi:hypothetical protein